MSSVALPAFMAGFVGWSFAPAFLSPGLSQGSQVTLRGTSAPAPVQGGASAASVTSIGVLATAAVAIAAAARPALRTRKAVTCHAFDPAVQVGATKPFGFFDPMGFAKNCTEQEFNKLRGAEIKHGRAAMMGSLGLLTQSVYKLPGYENVPSGLGAQWTEPGSNTLVIVFFLIGCLEIGLSPWSDNPTRPGDYGDPLNLGNYSEEMRNKELNNGRMAMFAVLGIVSAELFTGTTGAAQFAIAAPKAGTKGSSFCGVSMKAGIATQTGCRAELLGRHSFDMKLQAGASAPLGVFDPLKLSSTQERFDKFRTAEIKHGRVAMLAALGSIFQHFVHGPGAEAVPNGLMAFQDPIGEKGVIVMTLACGFLELGPWADAFAKEPGNFGDPAGLGNDIGSYNTDMKTKELNNGRLAMLATMGVIAAELATGDRVSDLPTNLGF